jgi:hypothetical protein
MCPDEVMPGGTVVHRRGTCPRRSLRSSGKSGDPAVAAELRDHLVAERRSLVGPTWERGVARGELSAEVDPDVGLDLIFGPAMYRPMAGHAPLTDDAADAIVEAAMRGLAL